MFETRKGFFNTRVGAAAWYDDYNRQKRTAEPHVYIKTGLWVSMFEMGKWPAD